MLAKEWARANFSEASRPDLRTVRGWVQRQQIPGAVIGKQTYVDNAAWVKQREAGVGTGDALADQILRKLN